MKYFLAILVLTIPVTLIAGNCVSTKSCKDIKECPANEYWKKGGKACEATCADVNGTRECTRMSILSACSCINGYVRDPDGDCVLPKDCPRKCVLPGEVWTKCGPKKESTCITGEILDDSDECYSGCYCDDGLIRHPNGSCVKICDCPRCDWNTEVFDQCGSANPLTCLNFNDIDREMTSDRCVAGCFCKKGLIFNKEGKCIKPEECPPPTCNKPNEVYDYCGTSCPVTCRNMGTKIKCSSKCIKGCFCEEGYVRTDSGDCVFPCDCPLKETCTKPFENYTECGSKKEQTCDNFWLYKPSDDCQEACLCETGYVRNKEGFCVSPEECPGLCKGTGEVYLTCGPMRELNCENCNSTDVYSKGCGKLGCYCKPGLVRNPYGVCVAPENCPLCDWENENYKICGSACPDSCSNIMLKNRPCSKACVPGCFCKNGLILNDEGKCIKPDNCPKIKCEEPIPKPKEPEVCVPKPKEPEKCKPKPKEPEKCEPKPKEPEKCKPKPKEPKEPEKCDKKKKEENCDSKPKQRKRNAGKSKNC